MSFGYLGGHFGLVGQGQTALLAVVAGLVVVRKGLGWALVTRHWWGGFRHVLVKLERVLRLRVNPLLLRSAAAAVHHLALSKVLQ